MGRAVLIAGRAGVLLVALAGCSERIGMPEPGTQQGDDVIGLWRALFWTAAVLGAVVLGLLGWCLLRYRQRGDGAGLPLPPQIRGNVALEATYIAIPTLIVAAIFVLSLRTDPATATAGADRGRALAVNVTGFQWQWRFEYPAEDVRLLGGPEESPDLVLPTGRTVRLRLESPDVIHSFFVPGFLGKVDLIPGRAHTMELRPVRPGRYQGFCAEFCGLNHARMNFTVRIVPPAEFAAWARQAAGDR